MSVDVGDGDGDFKLWYYNNAGRECEEFSYTGKGGNENRFKNKHSCEQTCIPGKKKSIILSSEKSQSAKYFQEIGNSKNMVN